MNKSIIIFFVCSMVLSYPCSLFAQGRIIRPSKQQTQHTEQTQQAEQTQTAVPKQESSKRAETPKHVIKQQVNRDEYGICQDQIVDLGLSVKWAGWNIGASSPEQEGTLFGWGDPTGKETSTDESKYPKKEPPMNICGDTHYDMATANWGIPWRLPTKKEFDELIKECRWEGIIYKGIKGNRIIGPNGNAVFFPVTTHRTPIWDPQNQSFSSNGVVESSDNMGYYYLGEIDVRMKTDDWTNLAFVGCSFYGSDSGSILSYPRSCGYAVRAVYAQ